MPALQERLTLVAWFARELGYADGNAMLDHAKEADGNWEGNCHSVLKEIERTGNAIDPATWQTLLMLDGEICADWAAINAKRQTPLQPKYFQYLACLASAYFLRRLAEDPKRQEKLLAELREVGGDIRHLESFAGAKPINKLAFWMATGAGKTLLLHIHYRQFLRHKSALFAPDNILLVTPNETLSRQHLEEMRASGIPCFRHGESSRLLQTPNAVRVVEITKLTGEEEKRKSKKGESVAVESFAGRNLVFVDEGHKGSGGEEWFKRRDQLTQNGFVFEYSATFGQALMAANNEERTKEYARAILFDYSYPHFYRDGYGKDFSILNVSGSSFREIEQNTPAHNTMMLGNLLAFFQQQWAFANRDKSAWRAYMIEKPLLLMLGTTVTAGGKESDGKPSDLTRLLGFLHSVTTGANGNDKNWLQNSVKKILSGNSKIIGGNGKDIFAGQFDLLRADFSQGENGVDAARLCEEMRGMIFHTREAGALRCDLITQSKDGGDAEICLRVGGAPFGLVYVSAAAKLCEMAARQIPGLQTGEDKIQKPLFAGAHLPASSVNILIGAKKFMEGWSSWRVCGMGLLNVGGSEGAQIIQLFGRGVRLRGKDFSLKRSSALFGDKPKDLPLLETLNIFAIRANFMENFREYIRREGVQETLNLPMKTGELIPAAKTQLLTLKPPPREDFDETVWHDEKGENPVKVVLNMGARAQAIKSGESAERAAAVGNQEEKFTKQIIDLLDFDWLYRRLLEYKRQKGRHNLILRQEALRPVLQKHCKVRGNGGVLAMNNYKDLLRIRQIALHALQQHAEKMYSRQLRNWETREMQMTPALATMQDELQAGYTIYIGAKMSEQKREEIKLFLQNPQKTAALYWKDSSLEKIENFQRLVFDRHIYVPLMLKNLELDIAFSPPGLNAGEENFVRNLRAYVKNGKLADDCQVYLYRNPARGRGVGLHEDAGFYPDFIMWVIKGGKQRLVFVEPHGMLHAPAYAKDEKARAWETLQKLGAKIASAKKEWRHISLDSYIISQTDFDTLQKHYGDGNWSKEKFAAHHILFATGEDDAAQDGEEAIRHIIETEPPPPQKGD